MQLTIDTLREFKKITSKDIELFFHKTVSFFSIEYNDIVAYYSGELKNISSEPFEIFEKIKRECSELFSSFQSHSKQLNNVKWWLLLEQLEEIDSRLQSLNNINRWSKSSLTKIGYSSDLSVQYTLKQNQTLEKVSSDILKSTDSEKWVDLAIKNNLIEEDYSSEGGIDIQLQFPQINQGIEINSVVDVMIGKSIYGKDLFKKLEFVTAEDDLCVLGYDETILQSADILSLLKKGDNPDFPEQGLQSAVVIGANQAMLNFPVISRQMQETFATDDSLQNFTIIDIATKEDNLSISYEVQTRLNETYDGQIAI